MITIPFTSPVLSFLNFLIDNYDEKMIHIFINTRHQPKKWKQNNNQMLFPHSAAESDTFSLRCSSSRRFLFTSQCAVTHKQTALEQAALEQALQIGMRRQQSFLLCSQFTGMPLAGFSVAQHIWAQTFIIASCLRALISVLLTLSLSLVWEAVPLEGVRKAWCADVDEGKCEGGY